jgi:hypothetical protein
VYSRLISILKRFGGENHKGLRSNYNYRLENQANNALHDNMLCHSIKPDPVRYLDGVWT